MKWEMTLHQPLESAPRTFRFVRYTKGIKTRTDIPFILMIPIGAAFTCLLHFPDIALMIGEIHERVFGL